MQNAVAKFKDGQKLRVVEGGWGIHPNDVGRIVTVVRRSDYDFNGVARYDVTGDLPATRGKYDAVAASVGEQSFEAVEPENKFKVGQKIKCFDASGSGRPPLLVEGEVYTVTGTRIALDGTPRVTLDGVVSDWWEHRFEETDETIFKFKDGQKIECIDAGSYQFTEGRVYEVLSCRERFSENFVTVIDDNGEKTECYESRFEAHEEPAPVFLAMDFAALEERVITISFNKGAGFMFDANIAKSRVLIDKILDAIYAGEV
jgi:hypothetical protein